MSLNCLVSGRFDTSRFVINRSRFLFTCKVDSIQTFGLLTKVNYKKYPKHALLCVAYFRCSAKVWEQWKKRREKKHSKDLN